jgi:hypothetical protein
MVAFDQVNNCELLEFDPVSCSWLHTVYVVMNFSKALTFSLFDTAA